MLNSYRKPLSLEFDSSSCVLFTGEQFDLSTVGASVRYTDNTSATAQNVQWSVQTAGGGSIEASSYTAPLVSGPFTLRAVYTENGISRTADFTAMVRRKLDKLILSVASAEIFAGESFNLSALTVQADYMHDVPTQTLSADQINWQKLSGSGTVTEGVYASSTSSGIAVLRASYTENGITASTDLSIEVLLRPLSLQIEPSSLAVFVNENYDLAQISTRLNYEYGLYEFLSVDAVSWTTVSGGGLISQAIYSAPGTAGSAVMRVSTSIQGTLLSTDLILDIKRRLLSLNLSPLSATIQTNGQYDLRTVQVSADYGDGQPLILNSSVIVWSLGSGGSGTIEDRIYKSGTTTGIMPLVASYTDTGVTRTAELSITVNRSLKTVTFSPQSIGLDFNAAYDLKNIAVTAHYDDGYTHLIPHSELDWFTFDFNLGSISIDKIFTAGTNSGTATMMAIYQSGNEEKILSFDVIISKNLQSVSLPVSSAVTHTGSVYELSNIDVLVSYEDGSSETVAATNRFALELLSGSGELSADGSVFNSGTTSGTAVLRISYELGGVLRSADFSFEIIRSLSSLVLSSAEAIIHTSDTYAMNNIQVTAFYDDGYSHPVESGLSWSVVGGSGTLEGSGLNSVFRAATTSGLSVMRASYTSGTRSADADFPITVLRSLNQLKPAEAAVVVHRGDSYNLNNSGLQAFFDDGYIYDLTAGEASWTKSSGPGSISGTENPLFAAGTTTGTAVLQVVYSSGTKQAETSISIEVLPVLDSIELSLTSTVIYTNQSYAVGELPVRVFYDDHDEFIAQDSNSLSWEIVSGSGSLSATGSAVSFYPVPEGGETVLRLNYDYGNLRRSADFTVQAISRNLSSLQMNPSSVSLYSGDQYFLRDIVLTASYSDSYTATVPLTSPELIWSIESGSGSLLGSGDSLRLRAGDVSGPLMLRANFVSGAFNADAFFTVNILRTLTGVALSLNTTAVYNDETFPFYGIGIELLYNDGGVEAGNRDDIDWLIDNWSGDEGQEGIIDGIGSLSVFTPGETTGLADFMGIFRYDNTGAEPVTFTTGFSINVLSPLVSVQLSGYSTSIYTNDSYEFSGLNMQAFYGDGYNYAVTQNEWFFTHEGSGLLEGSAADSIFRAGTTTGRAVLQIGYEANRINGGKMSRTTDFIIDILPSLQSIGLDYVSSSVHAGYSLSLADIGFTAFYDDESSEHFAAATDFLQWVKLSGGGEVNGSVFNAGLLTGTSELSALYTVAKSSGGQMSAETGLYVSILRSLTGIYPYPISTSLPTDSSLPLSAVSLTAVYHDGYTYQIPSSDDKLIWSTTSMTGIITGTGLDSVFHSGSGTGITTLQAAYSYGPDAVTTDFMVEVFGSLESISLSTYTTMIYSRGAFSAYALDNIQVRAHYSDGNSVFLIPEQVNWHKISGPEGLNGNDGNAVFQAAGTTGTALLQAGYSFGNQMETTDFSIEIYRTLDRIVPSAYVVQIYTGGSYSLSGSAAPLAYYDDGYTEVLSPGTSGLDWVVNSAPSGAGLIAGDSIFQAGTQTGISFLTASFSSGGITVTTEISIEIMRSVTGLSLSKTTTSIYYKGDTCALDNVSVRAVYDDGYIYELPPAQVVWSLYVDKGGTLTNRIYTSGSTSGSIGQASVNATYLGKTARFYIEVLPILESISAQPVQTSVYTGSEFSMNNIVINAHYDGADTAVVSPSSSALSWSSVSLNDGGNFTGSLFSSGLLTGEALLRASYLWGPTMSKTTDVLITVLPTLSSLSLSYESTGIFTNETLSLDDVLVTAHYADGSGSLLSVQDLSWSLVSPAGIGVVSTGAGGSADFTAGGTTGTAVLRVSHSSGNETRTTDLEVTILGSLVSIYSSPVSTELYTNGNYGLSDVTIVAVYDDGYEHDVNPDSPSLSWSHSSGPGSVSGSGSAVSFTAGMTTGMAELQATYSAGSETKTTTFAVLVKPSLVSLQISPVETAIHTNETYSLQNIRVTAVYDDTGSEEILLSSGDITWITSSVSSTGILTESSSVFSAGIATGENVLQINHIESGLSALFTVDVHRSLSHLSISPERKAVDRGDSYDLDNIVITAVYDDGYEQSLLSTDSGLQWVSEVLVVGTTYNTETRVFTASNEKDYSEFSLSYTTDKISSGQFTATTFFYVDVVDPLSDIILYDYTETLLDTTIITRNSSYDLRNVIVRALYVNEFGSVYTEDVAYDSPYLSWSAVSLSGESILTDDNLNFVSKNDAGDNILRATYSWGGSPETTDFKITVQAGLLSINFAYASTYVYIGESYNLSNLSPTSLSDAQNAVPEPIAVTDLIWTIVSTDSPGYLDCFQDPPSNQQPACFSSDAAGSTTLQAGYYSVLGEFKTTQVVIDSLRRLDHISLVNSTASTYTNLAYRLNEEIQVRAHYTDGTSGLMSGDDLNDLYWREPVSGGSLNTTTFVNSVFTAGSSTGTYNLTLDLIRPDMTKSATFSMELMRTLIGLDPGTPDFSLYVTQAHLFTPQLVYDDGYREGFLPEWSVTGWTGAGNAADAGEFIWNTYIAYTTPGVLTFRASGSDGPFSVTTDVHVTIVDYPSLSWAYLSDYKSAIAIDGANNIFFNGGTSIYRLGTDGIIDWTAAAATVDMTEHGDFMTQPAIGALTGNSGSVYSAHFLGRIYARNISDGSARWEADINSGLPQESTELWDFFAGSAPALSATTLYIASYGRFSEGGKGRIYSFKKSDGTSTADFSFQADSAIMVTPAIGGDGTLYVGDFAGKVYAVDGSGGAKKWTFTENAQEGFVGAAILHETASESVLYMLSTSGRFYSLDTSDGSKNWRFDLSGFGGSARTPAVGADGTVYISDDTGKLYALNKSNGSSKWTTTVAATVLNSPLIGADGVIFTGATNGSIYAFSPDDGSILWNSFHTGSEFQSLLIAENGFLYAMSAAGVVYSFSMADIKTEYGVDLSAGLPVWSTLSGNQRNNGQSRYHLAFAESGVRISSLSVTAPEGIVLNNGSDLVVNFADRSDDSVQGVNASVDWTLLPGSDGCISGNSYIIPAKNMSGTLQALYEHSNSVGAATYISTYTAEISISSSASDRYFLSLIYGGSSVENITVTSGSTVKLGATNPDVIVRRTDITDNSTLDVNGSVTWSKLSGFGTLSGTDYTAPASGKSGTLQASYTYSYPACSSTYDTVYTTSIVITSQ